VTPPPVIICPAVSAQAPLNPNDLSPPVFLQQGWMEKPQADFLPAAVRVGWTPGGLVILAEIPDRDIFTLATAPNQKMWELGDVFEIFLQDEDRSDYVELHVTPANLRLQLRFETSGATPVQLSDGVFSSHVGIDSPNQRWSLQASVPAVLVSGRSQIQPGEVWRFSFSRYDASRDGTTPVLSSTSPHQAINFHRNHEWGKLTFA
jgi:hypothetical protein